MYKTNWLNFEDAREFVRKLELKSKTEWENYCKSGIKPKNIPYNPVKFYKDKWIDWANWLGKEKTKPLYVTHPDIFVQIDSPKVNKNTNLDKITAGSSIKLPFKCNKCEYKWETTIHHRTRKKYPTGCPSCSGRIATSENCVAITHPHLIKEWHPTKNGDKTLWDFTHGSGHITWWYREECGHEWQAEICDRTDKNCGCPFCSNRRTCLDNCTAVTHPHLIKEWHTIKNGRKTLWDFTHGSGFNAWWYKEECGHEWQARIHDRTRNNPTDCPFCDGKKVSPENSLEILFPGIAAEWDYEVNKDILPIDVMPGSSKKFGWKCKCCGHKWLAISNSRTRKKHPSGCPRCEKEKLKGSNHPNWNPDRNYIKLRTSIGNRCSKLLRNCLALTGQKKTTKTEIMLGYTRDDLYNHLINHPNWKDGSHIDHILPIKAFVDHV